MSGVPISRQAQVKAPGTTRSRPLVAAFTGQGNLDEAGHRTLSEATPNTVVSLRSPGDQLSTSRPQQTKRLGRQVILAQPSASSRGSRLRRVVRSSTSILGVRLQWLVSLFLLLELSALHLLLVISLILLCITT